MRKSQRLVVLFLGLAGCATWLAADTVRLRNGSQVEGTFLGGDTRQVKLISADGNVQNFDISDIESIRFGGAATTTVAPPVPPRAASQSTTSSGQATAPAATSGAREVAPAGTVITVRMIDSVDSDVNGAGERFRASLDDPLQVGEKTIAPRGADVTVQVVRVQQSGKLTGRDEVSLELYDITINGKKYPVASSYAEASSSSRTARTGKVVGGGAALGAIIGAIAGGGKGAAIGAATGAGAGVAVEMATKGQRVKIPSESRLEFTLKQPLAVE